MNDTKIIIISSPSGAGKTTICNKILKKNKDIKLSVSYTTRPKRKGEIDGIDYFFINKEAFIKLKKINFFIETAKVFDHLYGSPNINIQKNYKKNKKILFDIDWQGAQELRKKFSSRDIIDFFILPPSKKELELRLKKRARENKNEIKKRLSLAVKEMKHYNEYKYVIINDNIDTTVTNVLKIIQYENLLYLIEKKVNLLKFIK